MKKLDLFEVRWWLKPLCGLVTNHKHKRLIFYSDNFRQRGFKYPNRADFHYKCKICGYVFFNHHINKEDLEMIKERDGNVN